MVSRMSVTEITDCPGDITSHESAEIPNFTRLNQIKLYLPVRD